jgi:hypothetical protein
MCIYIYIVYISIYCMYIYIHIYCILYILVCILYIYMVYTCLFPVTIEWNGSAKHWMVWLRPGSTVGRCLCSCHRSTAASGGRASTVPVDCSDDSGNSGKNSPKMMGSQHLPHENSTILKYCCFERNRKFQIMVSVTPSNSGKEVSSRRLGSTSNPKATTQHIIDWSQSFLNDCEYCSVNIQIKNHVSKIPVLSSKVIKSTSTHLSTIPFGMDSCWASPRLWPLTPWEWRLRDHGSSRWRPATLRKLGASAEIEGVHHGSKLVKFMEAVSLTKYR